MNSEPYYIFPYYFSTFKDDMLMTNDSGESYFLSKSDFDKLMNHKLDITTDVFDNLKSRFFVTDSSTEDTKFMQDVRIRTRIMPIFAGVTLHMVVPTIRCNSQCIYCQVSSQQNTCQTSNLDMDLVTAKQTVDMIFKSSSEYIKIEFQGGEPTLNFDIVTFIVKYAKSKAARCNKSVEFVICTNMLDVSDKMLAFIYKHNISISTSLDGPITIHNANRPAMEFGDSYLTVLDNIKRARDIGINQISALMTVTQNNLYRLKEVVDEYLMQEFSSVFIRPINPFGRAITNQASQYSSEEFINEYLKCLEYIFSLNSNGVVFTEEFIAILARTILTPFNSGFVDLQSPSAAGSMCAVYNHDGKVYVSDEGRMLGEIGDFTFQLGTVEHEYNDVFHGKLINNILEKTVLSNCDDCSKCVYKPFCGNDVVKNYVGTGELFASNSTSCKYLKPVFDRIFQIIHDDDEELDILYSWIQ